MEEIAFTPGSVPVVVVARVYGKDASFRKRERLAIQLFGV